MGAGAVHLRLRAAGVDRGQPLPDGCNRVVQQAAPAVGSIQAEVLAEVGFDPGLDRPVIAVGPELGRQESERLPHGDAAPRPPEAARRVNREIAGLVDVLIGDEYAWASCLGIKGPERRADPCDSGPFDALAGRLAAHALGRGGRDCGYLYAAPTDEAPLLARVVDGQRFTSLGSAGGAKIGGGLAGVADT